MKKIGIILVCLVTIAATSPRIEAKKSTQKKAVIIGASFGIGKAIAQELLKHDYKVGITSRRLNILVAIQNEDPDNIFVKQMDVTEYHKAREQLDELIQEMGGVDLVVVNAGAWPESGQIPVPWEPEKQTIDVNVSGFTAIANAAFNYFINQGHGHLVGISSVDALRGHAFGPAYCASKAFEAVYLEGLRNKSIQNNLGVDVTEIRPGFVSTHEMPPSAYWIATPETAAQDIYKAIVAKKKVAYVTKKWELIAWLLLTVPDYIYNKIGGF
jgi:short-subunit dehydrogenase